MRDFGSAIVCGRATEREASHIDDRVITSFDPYLQDRRSALMSLPISCTDTFGSRSGSFDRNHAWKRIKVVQNDARKAVQCATTQAPHVHHMGSMCVRDVSALVRLGELFVYIKVG